MILVFVFSGLTVLVVMCIVAYGHGYDVGYDQATTDVHNWIKRQETTP